MGPGSCVDGREEAFRQTQVMAANLRWAKRHSGATAQAIAEAIGTNERLVRTWLSGKGRPSPASLGELCEFFKASAAWFVTDHGHDRDAHRSAA